MNKLKSKTDYRFKILYAVGIIMVCSGHTFGGGISLLNDWFPYYGFHLALFVFCSGYFYKNESEQNVGKYIVQKARTLLVPLYLYNLAYGIIVQLLKIKDFSIGGDFNLYNITIAPLVNGHQFMYNMGGWFVVPLFMVEVYNILLRRLTRVFSGNAKEHVLFAVSIATGLIGNQMAIDGYNENWWLPLVRMFYFVPFYGLGIYYKNILEKYDKKIPSFWYFTFIFAVQFIIIIRLGKPPVYVPSFCNDFTDGPVMPIIAGCLGIALWLRVSTIFEPVIGKSKWINIIADNTYSIMINQFMGFMALKTLFAVLSVVLPIFNDFDWLSYKTDITWYYMPKGSGYIMPLYVAAGIIFSIAVQKGINILKKNAKLLISKQENAR